LPGRPFPDLRSVAPGLCTDELGFNALTPAAPAVTVGRGTTFTAGLRRHAQKTSTARFSWAVRRAPASRPPRPLSTLTPKNRSIGLRRRPGGAGRRARTAPGQMTPPADSELRACLTRRAGLTGLDRSRSKVPAEWTDGEGVCRARSATTSFLRAGRPCYWFSNEPPSPRRSRPPTTTVRERGPDQAVEAGRRGRPAVAVFPGGTLRPAAPPPGAERTYNVNRYNRMPRGRFIRRPRRSPGCWPMTSPNSSANLRLIPIFGYRVSAGGPRRAKTGPGVLVHGPARQPVTRATGQRLVRPYPAPTVPIAAPACCGGRKILAGSRRQAETRVHVPTRPSGAVRGARIAARTWDRPGARETVGETGTLRV